MIQQFSQIRGVEGLSPQERPVLAVTVGRRAEGGFPINKKSFYFMGAHADARNYGKFSAKGREPHPAYAKWNALADRENGKEFQGGRRTSTVEGMFIHAKLGEAADWRRARQKGPSGAANPPSDRPWCSGNGVEALRFCGTAEDGAERFETVPCAGSLCPYAIQQGKADVPCKPRLRVWFLPVWGSELSFPQYLAEWSTQSPQNIESFLGMMESLLGTARVFAGAAVAPGRVVEGLVDQLGIENPSIFGFRFSMSIIEETSKVRQTRYPLVRFTAGDPVAFLNTQAALCERLRSLPAPASHLRASLPASFDDADGIARDFAAAADLSPTLTMAEIVEADVVATEDQVFELVRECNAAGVDPAALCAQLGVKTLGEISAPSVEELATKLRQTVALVGTMSRKKGREKPLT